MSEYGLRIMVVVYMGAYIERDMINEVSLGRDICLVDMECVGWVVKSAEASNEGGMEHAMRKYHEKMNSVYGISDRIVLLLVP